MRKQDKPKFEFYVLNYDPNAKKVINYNIFNNSLVYKNALEEVKKYCNAPKKYCCANNVANEDSYIYGFKAFCKILLRTIQWQEWSRREYEIFVGDAFEDDIKKFEKWDCWYQAAPNIKVIAREVIRSYEEWLENSKDLLTDEWILVSNRLPTDDEDYLITDGESIFVGSYRDDADEFGWLEKEREDERPSRMGKVIAWRELPELYKNKSDIL